MTSSTSVAAMARAVCGNSNNAINGQTSSSQITSSKLRQLAKPMKGKEYDLHSVTARCLNDDRFSLQRCAMPTWASSHPRKLRHMLWVFCQLVYTVLRFFNRRGESDRITVLRHNIADSIL